MVYRVLGLIHFLANGTSIVRENIVDTLQNGVRLRVVFLCEEGEYFANG